MAQMICQWVVVAAIVARMLAMIYIDIEGKEKIEPKGFQGVMGTLIATALACWLYWGAGTFDVIFGASN